MHPHTRNEMPDRWTNLPRPVQHRTGYFHPAGPQRNMQAGPESEQRTHLRKHGKSDSTGVNPDPQGLHQCLHPTSSGLTNTRRDLEKHRSETKRPKPPRNQPLHPEVDANRQDEQPHRSKVTRSWKRTPMFGPCQCTYSLRMNPFHNGIIRPTDVGPTLTSHGAQKIHTDTRPT
jgi:hypothetical protein